MTLFLSTDAVTLHHGDCLEELRALPDASAQAVICDPPYEISFMNRDWDGTKIAYSVPLWSEVLRVLVPGGHLACFGGTRTYHRVACAVEDAGFEIRDSLAAWLYGCLTDDAEILTEQGWRPGVEVERDDRVAQWDPTTGSISLTAVQETFRAPWDGPMRVLRNADTDQVLTPNHRVYHRPWRRHQVDGARRGTYGAWEVREAAQVSTWGRVQLPVAGEHDGPGVGGLDYAALLGWVWSEGGFDHSGTGVRIYQSSVNPEKVAEIDALLDRLGTHKRYDRERTWRGRNYVETCWFFSGELAARVRADLPGKRPTYDLLWRMTGTEKRALRDAALLGDGHVDRRGTWQFYQRHEDDLVWFSTLLALVGQAGKVGMRPDRDNGTVYVRDRATTELQARHLRDDVEHYQGEVWCVRVPTGAFVARRNGRVFITGNSGFPKSLDVGKAIDATITHGGSNSRRIKATNASRPGEGRTGASLPNNGVMSGDRYANVSRDAPATDAAREWEGWGTALKPAFEPILLARKPLGGTVATNVLTHRAGALNVNACRIGEDEARIRVRPPSTDLGLINDDAWSPKEVEQRSYPDGAGGRWPTNVVLAHHPEDTDDECHPWCQVAGLDEQSGITKTSAPSESVEYGAHNQNGDNEVFGKGLHSSTPNVAPYGDSGGASRFFPTFRYQAKAPKRERPEAWGKPPKCSCETPRPLDPETGALPPAWRSGTVCAGCEQQATHRGHPTVKPLSLLSWLVDLLVVPGGTVIDPFAGSGPLGQAVASRKDGTRAVLIERDEHSCRLIAQRLGVSDLPRSAPPLVEPKPVSETVVDIDLPNWLYLCVSCGDTVEEGIDRCPHCVITEYSDAP